MTLTDNVLLEIFVFYKDICSYCTIWNYRTAWKWHILVHVCRRWRQIIFASPNRLDLRILCTHKTPVRKSLDIWPPFPIAIYYCNLPRCITPNDEDNIVAALEHPDRVHYLGLSLGRFQLKKMVPMMKNPLPMLTHLHIFSEYDYSLEFPADLLGVSAPCLQEIYFDSFPYPALPTLLLSASGIITLKLHNIAWDGYISPDTMVASLAVLTRLEHLSIKFDPVDYEPIPVHVPPPMARTVLPTLTSFEFQGDGEYLEALVAPIDGAQLNWICIDYLLRDTVDFPAVQLSKFFNRSAHPGLVPFTLAEVFIYKPITFDMYCRANIPPGNTRRPSTHLSLECGWILWRVQELTQVFSQFSEILSSVVYLKLKLDIHVKSEHTGVEWLHFLDQFSTVQALYIARRFADSVALALENITGERVAEAWPSLDLICLENQPLSSMEKFISARQRSGRPVTVIHTQEEFDQRLLFYVQES